MKAELERLCQSPWIPRSQCRNVSVSFIPPIFSLKRVPVSLNLPPFLLPRPPIYTYDRKYKCQGQISISKNNRDPRLTSRRQKHINSHDPTPPPQFQNGGFTKFYPHLTRAGQRPGSRGSKTKIRRRTFYRCPIQKPPKTKSTAAGEHDTSR